MAIERVGVVGFGQMGGGIAQVCAAHGLAVVVLDVDEGRVQAGATALRGRLEREVGRGRLEATAAEATLGRVRGTTHYEDLAGCDLLIEAALEDLDAKRSVFRRLAEVAGPDAILASNTSSLPIAELAAASSRPERLLGLHFFNPPWALALVEIAPTEATEPAVVAAVRNFCARIERVVVQAKDTPGFIVNRLLIPFVLDAIRLVETSTASAADIDTACKAGLGHTLGPLATADLVGLDTLLLISEALFEELGEARYKAPTLLRRMVALGRLGRKSKRGFFAYE